ncbi:hypothetical protein BJ912DRAFT_853603 [Pholiota molesta]|nr:hypothetical protein BJ912DRAFT_853603 [Pholiota molesta]
MDQDALNARAAELLADPQALDEFMQFMKNEIANPPKVVELFKIPEGLSPAWQEFFDKVAAYYERQCAANRHALISLEKRSWIMEDEKLCEFEMLMSATDMKEKGNEEFKKGDSITNIARAEMLYSSSISTFPTPDAMNNMAASLTRCRATRFDIAESFATKALDMDLFSIPLSSANAHFARSVARTHLAKFDGAKADALAVLQSDPSETSVEGLLGRIQALSDTVKTIEQVEQYLSEQPQPPAEISFDQAFDRVQDLQMSYIRIPPVFLEKMKPRSIQYHIDALQYQIAIHLYD